MKNYIGFINDHSGSMASLATAAMADYNANIAAVIQRNTPGCVKERRWFV